MWKVISKPRQVCGVTYVDVQTKHGLATKLKAEVDLLNRLMTAGLSFEEAQRIIMNEVLDYALESQRENEIE